MKMKKIAAASLAVCVCALSGMSALAADVATTTTYDWNDRDNDNATVKVTSVVSDVAEGTQVTYLVWGNSEDSIKYIDQKAADAAGATFEFTAKQGDIYSDAITAKFGSNGSYTLPKNFKFNDGVNRITAGTATVTPVDGAQGIVAEGGKAYFATVSGEVAEYGYKITNADNSVTYFPAAGSTANGEFCIVFTGLADGVTPEVYVVGLAK
mgnify:CR=1 FL=1